MREYNSRQDVKDKKNASTRKARKDPIVAQKHRDEVRKYHRENPEKKKRYPEMSRAWEIKTKYGLTVEEYDAIVRSEISKCRICGRTNDDVKLVLDHNHETGDIRGVLCPNCNTGIGLFKDNPDLLEKAIEYLKDASNTSRS